MKINTSRITRSAFWPAFLSAFVAPGIGQIANREISKGVLLLTASIGSFLWFSKVITELLSTLLPGTPEQWTQDPNILREAVLKLVNQNPEMFFTFQILIILVWGFGVVDAYMSARKRLRPGPLTGDETENPEP